MTTLTPFARKALAIIRDHGPYRNLSSIGYMMFTERTDMQKRNPSPQGTALAASRFVKPLVKLHLVRDDWDHGYTITRAGRELLDELDAADRAQQALPATGEGA